MNERTRRVEVLGTFKRENRENGWDAQARELRNGREGK